MYSKKNAYIAGAIKNATNMNTGLMTACLRQLVSARTLAVINTLRATAAIYVAYVAALNAIVIIGRLPCGKSVKVVIKFTK